MLRRLQIFFFPAQTLMQRVMLPISTAITPHPDARCRRDSQSPAITTRLFIFASATRCPCLSARMSAQNLQHHRGRYYQPPADASPPSIKPVLRQ